MESKRKKLEDMLRAVQDLKEEYYIGTQDAWLFLNRVRAIYSTPKIIADKVNCTLELQEGDYKANSERIVGYIGFMMDIGRGLLDGIAKDDAVKFKICSRLGINHNITNYEFIIQGLDYYLHWDPYSILSMFHENTRESLIDYHVDYFAMMFSYVIDMGVINDVDFGRTTARFLRFLAKNIPPEEHYIDEKSGYELNSDAIKEGITIISEISEMDDVADWGYYLSKLHLREVEKNMSRLFRCLCGEPDKMIKRILKDGISNNLKYRRQIISSVIDILCGLDKKVTNYNQLLEVINSVKGEDNRYLKDLDIPIGNSYLNYIMAAEKNFINKILKN